MRVVVCGQRLVNGWSTHQKRHVGVPAVVLHCAVVQLKVLYGTWARDVLFVVIILHNNNPAVLQPQVRQVGEAPLDRCQGDLPVKAKPKLGELRQRMGNQPAQYVVRAATGAEGKAAQGAAHGERGQHVMMGNNDFQRPVCCKHLMVRNTL